MGVAVNMKAVFDDDLRTKPQTLESLVYPVRDTKLLCVDIEGISVDTDLIAEEKIYCKEKKIFVFVRYLVPLREFSKPT